MGKGQKRMKKHGERWNREGKWCGQGVPGGEVAGGRVMRGEGIFTIFFGGGGREGTSAKHPHWEPV